MPRVRVISHRIPAISLAYHNDPFSSCLFVSSSCERTHTLRPGLITDRLIARGIRAHNSWRPNKLSSRGCALETFRIYTKLRTRFPPLNDCWTYLCHRVILEGERLVENAFRVHEIIKRCGNHPASSCTDYFQPKFLRPDHPPLLLETNDPVLGVHLSRRAIVPTTTSNHDRTR